MKLLIISPSHVRGGVENYALKIAVAARNRGWETCVAFPSMPEMESLVTDFEKSGSLYSPLDILDEGSERKTFRAHSVRFLRTLAHLNKLKPDMVQINVPWLDKCISSIVACGFLRIPTQVVFHLAPEKVSLKKSFRKLGLWAKERGQEWVAVSKHNLNMVEASYGVSSGSMQVIYNGIQIPDIKDVIEARAAAHARVLREFGLSEEHRLLLTVGRLSLQKGYHDLLDVVAKISRSHPHARFLWAGEGELRPHLERVIEEQGLGKTVLLLGHRRDVPELLRASDLFIFPSHFEGFPFALLEAMAHRVPFIANEVCGVSELAEHNVHGLLCRSGDRSSLLDSISWALDHPDKMYEMIDNSFVRVQEYSEEKMLQTTLSSIESLRTRKNNG